MVINSLAICCVSESIIIKEKGKTRNTSEKRRKKMKSLAFILKKSYRKLISHVKSEKNKKAKQIKYLFCFTSNQICFPCNVCSVFRAKGEKTTRYFMGSHRMRI